MCNSCYMLVCAMKYKQMDSCSVYIYIYVCIRFIEDKNGIILIKYANN